MEEIKCPLKTKINTSLAALGALAHRLQRCTDCKFQNGCKGAPKRFKKGSTYLDFGALQSTFAQ